uniref:GDT1 family protein n=2 Tax=Hemiselmis andersenii TaxID=464988 RepID=A0A7S1DXN9_HEMAN
MRGASAVSWPDESLRGFEEGFPRMRRPLAALLLLVVCACILHPAVAPDPEDTKEAAKVPDETTAPKVKGTFDSVAGDAFISSFIMIITSELGDKTFFIAAILAMKNSRAVVLTGALGALALMTVLSAGAGRILPALLPRVATHWASVLLFLVFGVKMLRDGVGMKADGPSDELEEVEAELGVTKKAEAEDIEGGNQEGGMAPMSYEKGGSSEKKWAAFAVLWQSFTLTFLAEWGDRSQIATIALAAYKDAVWVTIGGILGHAICTGLAVLGGRMIASRISERTVTLSGGALFIAFALHGVLTAPK